MSTFSFKLLGKYFLIMFINHGLVGKWCSVFFATHFHQLKVCIFGKFSALSHFAANKAFKSDNLQLVVRFAQV